MSPVWLDVFRNTTVYFHYLPNIFSICFLAPTLVIVFDISNSFYSKIVAIGVYLGVTECVTFCLCISVTIGYAPCSMTGESVLPSICCRRLFETNNDTGNKPIDILPTLGNHWTSETL